jgi:hypothetical protein
VREEICIVCRYGPKYRREVVRCFGVYEIIVNWGRNTQIIKGKKLKHERMSSGRGNSKKITGV